jgi:ATP-dependent RNA helicase RhlE
MPFKALRLNEPILRALSEQGYQTPTPIQSKAIPPILEGRDVLGCAQTGTGKTAAFALPVIHRLHAMPADKARKGAALPRALVLSPTRELASQIDESFQTYGRHIGLAHAVIYGGVSQVHQVRALQRGVDVLVATPGRLIDLMEQRLVHLTDVRIFILDEADRMLDMGFIQPIRKIAAALKKDRQTLLFSATMPREIMHLADSLLRDPVKVSVAPAAQTEALIEQRLYMIDAKRKQALLERLLEDPAVTRAVVFTKTKHGADRVCRRLERAGVTAVAIHGNKAQNYRNRALNAFRGGKVRVLVATDVAARGLDVDNITHVFNFDLPMEPEAYVHRIGRTGRAGATGVSISFCDSAERGLLRDVQRLLGKQIPLVRVPDDLPEPVAQGEHAPHHSPTHKPHQPPHRGSHRGAHAAASRSDGATELRYRKVEKRDQPAVPPSADRAPREENTSGHHTKSDPRATPPQARSGTGGRGVRQRFRPRGRGRR